jgi:hypothetical protein
MEMQDVFSVNNMETNIPIIETKNLLLRELNPEIYDYIFENLTDYELMNFLGINARDLSLDKEHH